MNKTLARVVAAAAALVTTLLMAAPAQAVSYRQFRTAGGLCLRPFSTTDGFDVRANSCSSSPTTRRDWQVINIGTFNNHPIWQLKNRATGKCLVRGDTSGVGYIFHGTCLLNNDNYWEVFKPSSSVIVLKSYGAYVRRGAHGCLKYLGTAGYANTDIRTCDTTSSLQQWRP